MDAVPTNAIPLLEVDSCEVRYGMVPALRGISIQVFEGEMVALLGANGAGKTTTLRALSGLAPPHRGRVLFEGTEIQDWSPMRIVRAGIAHMPEGRDLFPQLTVAENLRFGYFPRMRSHKGDFRSSFDWILELFPKLRERRTQEAGTLSGGEQQMLAAGMALIAHPRLLLVDELSLGLAPLIVEQLFAALRRANEGGTSILLVEQFVTLALANTTRAYVLNKGVVSMMGKSSDLATDPTLVSSYLGGRIDETEPAGVSEAVLETIAEMGPKADSAPPEPSALGQG
jgi:branched-chain amino acid transport system ATP-binding protein